MHNKTKNFNVCVKVIILIDSTIKNISDYYESKKTICYTIIVMFFYISVPMQTSHILLLDTQIFASPNAKSRILIFHKSKVIVINKFYVLKTNRHNSNSIAYQIRLDLQKTKKGMLHSNLKLN